MAKTGLVWTTPPSVLAQRVGDMRSVLRQNVADELDQLAQELKAWADANHPWQNQTGDAERLFEVVVTYGGLRLEARHGVYYGKFLEFKHGGKWGVIRPLMNYARGPGKQAMNRALEKTMR